MSTILCGMFGDWRRAGERERLSRCQDRFCSMSVWPDVGMKYHSESKEVEDTDELAACELGLNALAQRAIQLRVKTMGACACELQRWLKRRLGGSSRSTRDAEQNYVELPRDRGRTWWRTSSACGAATGATQSNTMSSARTEEGVRCGVVLRGASRSGGS